MRKTQGASDRDDEHAGRDRERRRKAGPGWKPIF